MEPLVAIGNYVNPFHEKFLLKIAFIPSDEFLETRLLSFEETIMDRLPVIGEIRDMLDSMSASDYIDSTWAGVNIDFQGRYGLSEVQIISPVFINHVAPKIKFWLSGIMIFCCAMWSLNRFTRFLGG